MARPGIGSRWRKRIGVGASVVALGLTATLGIYEDAPLLAILSPPGAGYDSTSGLLYTARGGAVTVVRAGTLSCNGGTVDANMPCVEGGALRIPTGQTTTTVLSPAPAAFPWCIRARLVRSGSDAAWDTGTARVIWVNDMDGSGDARLFVSGTGMLTLQIFDSTNTVKAFASPAAALSTGTANLVRACYDGSAGTLWVDGVAQTVTASGSGTGVLPGLRTTHNIGSLRDGTLQLLAGIDSFCFHPSLTACQ